MDCDFEVLVELSVLKKNFEGSKILFINLDFVEAFMKAIAPYDNYPSCHNHFQR